MKSSNNGNNRDNNDNSLKLFSQNESSITDKLISVVSCCFNVTVRFIKNLPNRIKGYFNRKIKDYKDKPKRKDIRRVYVLVGYISKKNADKRHRSERLMISFRRGLLILCAFLIFVISIEWLLPKLDFDQYKQMFGISSIDEMTENDPFVLTPNTESETTSVTSNN